jgi:hypothetical protein
LINASFNYDFRFRRPSDGISNHAAANEGPFVCSVSLGMLLPQPAHMGIELVVSFDLAKISRIPFAECSQGWQPN